MKNHILTLTFLTLAFSSFAQITPKLQKTLLSSHGWEVDDTMRYAIGDYSLYSNNNDTTLSQVDKPIIIAEGWDPIDQIDEDDIIRLFNEFETNTLAQSLLDEGYDIIILNYRDGADYIQKNAGLLRTLIELINANKTGSNESTVVGISMGGIVARLALREMELDNVDHECGLYVSYDAPQKGANLPLGYLALIRQHDAGGGVTRDVIERPATKQLLNRFESVATDMQLTGNNNNEADALHTQLYNRLDEIGLPADCRNIAVANGTYNNTPHQKRDGTPLEISDSLFFLEYQYSASTNCADTNNVQLLVVAQRGDQNSLVHSRKINQCVKKINTSGKTGLGRFIRAIISLFDDEYVMLEVAWEYGYETAPEYDVCQGSADPIVGGLLSEIEAPLADGLTLNGEAHTFIPTVSALLIDDNNVHLDIRNEFVEGNRTICLTPFDDFYAPNIANQEHVDLPTVTANWLYNQIIQGENETLTANETYNITQNVVSVVSRNIEIESGSKLLINGSGRPDYKNKNSTGLNDQPFSPAISQITATTNPCNDVSISVKGTLEIGDGNTRIGVFKIRDNGKLIQYPNGVLRIKNNSSLIIDEGGTLVIKQSTQIILDGPNAILEIRGNLVLEDGAIFQPVAGPNGQGFVRFNQQNVHAGTATTLVNVGNNSQMIFEATSNTTKVLEVASTDFWINDQGKSFRFTLKNGKAEMAHEAMMNLGCRVTLDGALVKKLPSAGHYRGIVLWNTGYMQLIRNSTFKEASEAVHFIGRNGGSRLIALDNQFTNNYNGLRLTGGSFWLREANLSDNNGYGLVATGQQRTSTLFQSTVNRNNFKGIRYESNIGAGLNLNTNDILENTIGVKFISRGNLNMKCNQVHGIAGFGSPIGLEFYHGNLNMTKTLFRTGNNSFKDNEKSILFPTGVGIEPRIELNNGWNRLSNKDVNSPAFYNSLEGTLDASNAIKLAENNHWDLNNNIPEFNSPFFGTYGNYQTYYLTRLGTWLAPTDFIDNGLTLNQSQFTNDWTAECTNNLKWKRSPGGLGDIYPVGEGTVVTSTTFNGKHLSECIEQILVTTADTLITDGERIVLWHELLTYDAFPEEIDKVDEYYLAVAETQLFDVLGNYLLEQENIHPGLLQDEVVNDVLEVCDFWEQELIGDISIYSARFRNKINLSKGHLYHMIDDNAAALNQFGSMQAWADTFALNESGYWMCHINNLEQLNASGYDADLLFSLPECTFSENNNILYKKSPEREQQPKVELEERFNVFPNPTKDYFNISFFTDQETTVSISLVDIYGKEIKDYGSMDTYIGDNRGRMSTEGLRAGTYFVRLTSNERMVFKKLVLLD
tara:strand:- start:36 stop:4031 length:3996 start_codon:yes stop_codon:yes gene_type:complete